MVDVMMRELEILSIEFNYGEVLLCLCFCSVT